jgi:hypothetical protein
MTNAVRTESSSILAAEFESASGATGTLAAVTASELGELTVVKLKDRLKALGIKTSGNKPEVKKWLVETGGGKEED